MDIQQLQKYWEDLGETLHIYSPSLIDKLKVDKDTFAFLTTCGLPSSVAPFLSFSEMQEDKLLTPNQAFKIDFKGLDTYLMFGCNGSGDPICIDTTKRNQVVYLNHDNYFERVFVNSSILQFAVCLTKYRDFIMSLIDRTGNGFKRKKFTVSELEQLKKDIKSIDSHCLTDTSFWTGELDSLQWEQDNE
jgi:hypothetical protein